MKPYTTLVAASLMILSASAQTYHSDAPVNGVQTLKVQGNLLLEQYNNGYGGDLNVPGDSNLSTQAIELPVPSGMSGFYHGPVKIGGSTTIGEYRFEKLGDEISGDFVVPLGMFYSYGSGINIDVMTSSGDPNSGGASFSLFGKTHREMAKITAVSHSAFGGGCGVKLHALNAHGFVIVYHGCPVNRKIHF